MFKRILIANRGEIALRIIRACRELGVESVCVYSKADAAAPYLREAKGCIVNVSSISGFRASRRTPAYAAVKALLVNYTASQAAALAADGVRVRAIGRERSKSDCQRTTAPMRVRRSRTYFKRLRRRRIVFARSRQTSVAKK